MTTPTLDIPDMSALYLGAPGRMLELPPPAPGVSPGAVRYSALPRGLDGTGTEWLFGTKRKYSMDLPHCTPTECRWLDLCWQGAIRPLWFIDPLTPNRFPADIAATGSTFRGEQRFLTSGGQISAIGERADFPEAPSRSVQLAGGTVLAAPPVLCLPGETLTFLSWTRADTAVTPSATFTDLTGAVLGQPNTGTAIAAGNSLIPSALAVVVPAGAATVTYALATASAATIVSSAWRVGADGGIEWTAGGGAYPVAMTERSATSELYPLTTITVSLEEL